MKTHTFPHSPQVFPHGFSTAGRGVKKRVSVNIIIFDKKEQISNFFVRSNFHHTRKPCAKITPLTAQAENGKKTPENGCAGDGVGNLYFGKFF